MRSTVNFMYTKNSTPQHWRPVLGVFDHDDDDPPAMYIVAYDGADWWDDDNCKVKIAPYAWAYFPTIPPKPKK